MMRMPALLLICLAATSLAPAEEAVGVPWDEIKALYREQVARELQKFPEAPVKIPQVFCIESARYTLSAGTGAAQGEVILSGKVLSGTPEPIPLLGPEVILTEVRQVTGGAVIAPPPEHRLSFLAETAGQPFEIHLAFLVPPQDEHRLRVLSFGVPQALQNTLDLTLPPGARLEETPGIADANGRYHLPAAACLSIKYLDKEDVAAVSAVEIETIARIRAEKNRFLIASSFLPMRRLPDTLFLQVPEQAVFLASSLPASMMKKLESGRYALSLPPEQKEAFTVEWALETPPETEQAVFALPYIVDNRSQEGRFVVEEPDDGQIAVSADGLVSQIPAEKLGEALRKDAGKNSTYMKVAVNTPITLGVKRFQTVSTPATVLESQSVYIAFEETGNVLSVLSMDVPPELGPRIRLKAAPEAEIWSLTVNGVKKTVFAGEEGVWMVPLDGGQVSHVELAFLKRGEKLGLQGTLEVLVPESGLPSRELRVGLALPARVELIGLEGPLSPATGQDWKAPAEFIGKAHFFSRAFYKGEGMQIKATYKEPMKTTAGQ